MTAGRRLRRAVVLSFPLAFALHDLEEVLTAGDWGRRAPELVRRRFPGIPRRVAELTAVTTPQMAVAVGVVGVGVAAATGSGLRRLDTDLGLLPPALTAFTAHGLTHLLQSAALRSYTPGVATVPLVIAPYSVWAWRALRRAGLRRDAGTSRRDLAAGGALGLGLVVAGQVLGAVLTRRSRRER